MNVHKVVLIIVDFDKLGADGVRDEINNMNYPNDCMSPAIMSIETKDIGEWAEDHPINKDIKSEASKLFPPTPPGLETVPEETMEALASLVDRLHLVHDDERYLSVWQVSQAHLGPYKGPQYTKELSHADAILTRHRATQDGK